MIVSKELLLDALPAYSGEIVLRVCELEDVERFAVWPSYPFPYETLNLSDRSQTPKERLESFRTREQDPNRVTLVADHGHERTMALAALVEIDWEQRRVCNMGFRVHPDWCDRGVGTRIMRTVAEWSFARGIAALRLDVTAANARAIRCYEKSGFRKTGEFWHDDPGLSAVDLSRTEYDFLRPHVRFTQRVPQICFWWMELTNGGRDDEKSDP